jgi:hypothetical protein
MTSDQQVYVPFFDTPTRLLPPLPSKEVLERVQLEKYRLDYLVRTGSVPFEDVRRGAEPPDFEVMRGESWHRLDCVALAVQEKRLAEALFTKLIEKVAVAGKDRPLEHLAGTHVTLWFSQGSQRPPRATDHSIVAEIVDALAQVEVDREEIAKLTTNIAAHGWPETFPKGFAVVDKQHFGFQVTPVDGWQPSNALSEQLGFDLSLSYPLIITDIRAELQRLVSGHDNGKIDELLVVIGGPNRDGICFPAEHIFGPWLRENSIEPLTAQHISRVTAHIWLGGDVLNLPLRNG